MRVETRSLQTLLTISPEKHGPFIRKGFSLERVTGIEPAWPAWKAGALPLSYTRE